MNRNKRGRPREVEDAVRVSIRISSSAYDRLDAAAKAAGKTIPALVRDRLAADLERELRSAWNQTIH